MKYEQRKHTRLKNYDYSLPGCYFITFCVKNKYPLLGDIVGRAALSPPYVRLSEIGKTADKYIKNIDTVYNNIILHQYVIMPNHIHLLIEIREADNGGLGAARPTISTVVRSIKSMVTREIGYSVWQASYYDRVVRNENEYKRILSYIEQNPQNWEKDEYNV